MPSSITPSSPGPSGPLAGVAHPGPPAPQDQKVIEEPLRTVTVSIPAAVSSSTVGMATGSLHLESRAATPRRGKSKARL